MQMSQSKYRNVEFCNSKNTRSLNINFNKQKVEGSNNQNTDLSWLLLYDYPKNYISWSSVVIVYRLYSPQTAANKQKRKRKWKVKKKLFTFFLAFVEVVYVIGHTKIFFSFLFSLLMKQTIPGLLIIINAKGAKFTWLIHVINRKVHEI